MSAEDVTLHPGMTALQIAAWCQRHRMFVTISWTIGAEGFLVPLLSARRELPLDHVPAFHKRQAE
jgi:hypothetical protein